jgi:hypothetical protein
MKTLLGMLSAVICLALITPLFAGEGKPNKEALKERMKQLDTDGDGKLSAEEKAAGKAAAGERKPGKPGAKESKVGLQQKILEKFDSNGNGKLDPDEQAAAKKASKERRKHKGKPGEEGTDAPPFNPGDGIGGLNGQPVAGGPASGPRGDGRAKLLERFDFNRDGQLSPEEMAQAKQWMAKLGGPGQGGVGLPPGIGRPGKPGRGPKQ